jgi:hypothetical protein
VSREDDALARRALEDREREKMGAGCLEEALARYDGLQQREKDFVGQLGSSFA